MMNPSIANDVSDHDDSIVNRNFLYEYAPCGHISFKPDGSIININQTLLEWLGLEDKENVYNKRFSDILSKAGQFYYQMIVLPLINMQGAVNEINFDILSANNTSFPCLFNAVTGKGQDKKVKVIHGVVIKITDRKKYESELLHEKKHATEEKKRFEFLANIIPNIIFTASCDGKIDFMNARFYEYFNYSKGNFDKNSFLHLVHQNDRFKAARLWTECFKQEIRFDAEVRLKNGNGDYEWFLVRAVPYKNETGKTSTWFGSCTNIHEHKEKEMLVVNELNNSLSTAGEIISKNEETLKEIAFDQAHLIRMPLSNILGLIQLMEMMEMNEEIQDIHTLLKQSSKQLDDVIKAIINKTYNDNSILR